MNLPATRATISYVQPDDPWSRRVFMSGLEYLLGRDRIEDIYREIKSAASEPACFFSAALDHAGINTRFDGFRLEGVPRSGPLLLIANHPFGIVDGLILCRTALTLRKEFRILLHALLCRDPDLDRYFLPVDFSGDKAAMQRNIITRREAVRALKDEAAVAIFPGGGVSTSWTRFGFGPAEEFPWSTFVAKLVRESGATVLPIYFHGRNSRLFHTASHIGEPLRLALLIHEALNKFGTTIRVTVGEPVTAAELDDCGGRNQITEHLQARVLSLGDGCPQFHPMRA